MILINREPIKFSGPARTFSRQKCYEIGNQGAKEALHKNSVRLIYDTRVNDVTRHGGRYQSYNTGTRHPSNFEASLEWSTYVASVVYNAEMIMAKGARTDRIRYRESVVRYARFPVKTLLVPR